MGSIGPDGESIPDVIGRISSTLSSTLSSNSNSGRDKGNNGGDDGPGIGSGTDAGAGAGQAPTGSGPPRPDLSARPAPGPDEAEPQRSTEATATDRSIPLEATVSDQGRVSRLALDPYWLANTDHTEVERELARVLNEALDRHWELENERIRRADVGVEAVMKNLMDLQRDVQRAYERDLNRVTEPLRRIEAANRHGERGH